VKYGWGYNYGLGSGVSVRVQVEEFGLCGERSFEFGIQVLKYNK